MFARIAPFQAVALLWAATAFASPFHTSTHEAGTNAPATDLETIRAALEAYETGVESFSLRYRVEVTPNPLSWKRELEISRRDGQEKSNEHVGEDEIPALFEERYELLVSGDRVRFKLPSSRRQKLIQIRAFDGKKGSQVLLDENNKTRGGAINLNSDDIFIDPSCPARVAGVRCGSRFNALHESLVPDAATYDGTKRFQKQLTYLVTIALTPNKKMRGHFYFDPSHEFLPTRIERVTDRGMWTVNTVTKFDQFANVATGQKKWFPSEILYEDYSTVLAGEIHSTHRIYVEHMEFNPDLSEELFRLDFPDGVLVADAETHETNVTGTPAARAELAEKAAKAARERLNAAIETANKSDRRASFSQISWVSWIAGILGFAGILTIVVGSWLRFRHGS
jgi:hypothetical protein